MTLFKVEGSPYWYYKFMIDGETYKASTRRRRKSEAAEVEAAKRQDVLNRKQLGHLPPIKLRDAVTYWIDHYGKETRSAKAERNLIRVMFEGSSAKKTQRQWTWCPNMPFHEMTEADVKRMIDHRVNEGLGPSSIRMELSILSRTRSRLKGLFLVPTFEFPTAKEDKRIKPVLKHRFLDQDEVSKLLKILDPRDLPDTPRNRRWYADRMDAFDLATLLLDTGVRPMEAMSLTWQDVHLNERRIHTHRMKVGKWSRLLMSDRVLAMLTRRYREAEGTPYVFPNRRMKSSRSEPHMTQCKVLQNGIERCGANTPDKVKRYGCRATIYTLRDTFASRLLQTGKVPLKDVSQLLGHSNVTMTEKYASLVPEQVTENAVAVLNGLNTH
ncbi:site-specific integrase [Hoeflea sp. YIM 152468]|uniref:tyrosine-type recombinase/integrase n=1 Tax=Hoeflea sp. YIM 152468 TaxID=3031759 RepID=UPI0023DBAC65|nr:site-specific integrase [Hoeflea sp. YIM 152468]MDF1610001.1 site-specific integrase [Hoeflea sp. YIM 152468]